MDKLIANIAENRNGVKIESKNRVIFSINIEDYNKLEYDELTDIENIMNIFIKKIERKKLNILLNEGK